MAANLSGVLLRLASVVVLTCSSCYLSGHISGAQSNRNRQYRVRQRAVRHHKFDIKHDLLCDIEWPFVNHAFRYVLFQEGSLFDCVR